MENQFPLTVNTIANGELKKQIEEGALPAIAQRIAQHGLDGEYKFTTTVEFWHDQNLGWQCVVKTVDQCTLKNQQLGMETPILVEDGGIYAKPKEKELFDN